MTTRVYVFSLVLVFLVVGLVKGQDGPPVAPPDTTQAATDQEQTPAKSPVDKEESKKKASEAETSLPHEHVIYVPFKNLRDVLDREDSSIVLPYAQFLEMWNRHLQGQGEKIKPPVNGVITRADYVGSVQGEVVHLDATLDVEVLSAEWAQLPVQFGDAAIGSAKTKDGAVLLRGVGQGRYELLVQGRGKHQIKLGLMTSVKTTAEGRSFTMKCPAVGVSNLDLKIPEQDLVVQVAPRRTLELRAERKDSTGVHAVLGSTNQFTVSWQPKSGSSEKAAGLANVTDMIAVKVGDGVVHTHAVLDYQILRGSLDELIVEAPANARLLDVQTPGLRNWQTEAAGDHQRVKVRLHAPATKTVRLELHTEMPIPEKAFQVGQFRAVGVARESGILAIRSAEDVGLEHVDRESITRVDSADVPASLRGSGGTFYKFFTPNHKLSVVASQLKPRIIVGSHLSILLEKARLTTCGEFQYEISRSGVFSLAYRLPVGFQVDDVHTNAMERFEVASVGKAQVLTVYFTKKMLGKLKVCVTASQPRDKSSGEVALPLLEPMNVTREEGLVAVIAPESLEVKTDGSQLRAARAATPGELTAKGFRPQIPERSILAAAFSFVTRPVHIVQTVTERPRRMFATVGTVVNVKEDVMQVNTTFHYRIQFAGTDRFRIVVPTAVGDRLQIDGDGIKERRKSPSAARDGTTEWTIVLHSEAIGRRSFSVSYEQRISISDRGTPLDLQPLQALDVDRETGEIGVYKDRALSIDAKSTGLEEIDPRELSQPLRTAQPYLTYRYYQHPAQLALSVTKHELQDVVKTVVRRAYIEAVVTEDGPMTVRARYILKSSERQRLAVTLRNPRILSVTVAGQSVAPEKAPSASGSGNQDKTYFINVARTADSDEPFQIAMVFETPRPDKELKLTDRLSVPLPQFDEGVKFQKVYVRTWAPKQYRLVGDPRGFVSHIGVGLWDSRAFTEPADNPDSWFSQDSSSFDFQVGGTPYLFSSLMNCPALEIGYWHIPTMTAIGSLIALAIGVVLLRSSLETKVATILALIFAVVFLGLFMPSLVYSWLLAARIGLAGVLAIWLIAWLLYVRRAGYFSPVAIEPSKAVAAAPEEPVTANVVQEAAVKSEETPASDAANQDETPAGDAEQ